ncbi:ATP-binding protein [Leptolinea tardivitalis]|uniref:ATP-binding protein n=1 Tax=Leptolinea tardivitalis TaxID=229920 RepID=UPI00078169EC|nr:ATP-binding protein [Leptolinea tardivitalis]GAP20349.1 histidine kinase [Leptolinea tardivitalis]
MILSLLETPTKINLPDSIAGWVGLGLYCLLFLICLIHWWDVPLALIQRRWQLLIFLFFTIIPANLFIGIGGGHITGLDVLKNQLPGMVLSAIPWFLISALFGPVLGGLAGLISGIIQAMLSTNSIFTPFIISLCALIIGVCFRQRYRGGLYALVRHPLGAAAITSLLSYILSSGAAFFNANGPLAGMVDAGLSNWRTDLLFAVVPIWIAGFLGEGLQRNKIGPWRKITNLLPSPEEGFSESKFWRMILPIACLFIFLFAQISWAIQTRQVRDVLLSSIASHAGLAAQYWAEENQSYIEKAYSLAQPAILKKAPMDFFVEMQKTFPSEKTRITVVDEKAMVIHQFPDNELSSDFSPRLLTAIKSALIEGHPAVISQHTSADTLTMTLDFVIPILQGDKTPAGVVILQQGNFPRPLKSQFWSEVTKIEDAGGLVWLVQADDKNPMLDDVPAPDIQSQAFPGEFLIQQGWKGSAAFAFWPSSKDWNVYIKVPPTAAASAILFDFSKQIILMVAGFALLLILLNLYWLTLFRDEQKLLQSSRQISRGNYDLTPALHEISELTDLSQAIEQIRVNVKAQMDEAQRLISIGRGVAVREEFGVAVEPILRAALRGDASCARVILIPPKIESVLQVSLRRFGLGERSDAYAVLDNQVLEICKREGIFVIRNTARSRRIDFNSAVTVPASIVGLPIYLEKDDFLGVFWIGYEKQQIFPDEEISLLKTLASEIAVAAAGERRLSETEQGRKQFEALIGAIQDPLLLLDPSGEVIYANEAALSVDGLILRDEDGHRVAALPSMQKTIHSNVSEISKEGIVREIQFADGRMYSARFTPFQTDGKFGGSLCVLRDVNSYAELLSRKGEFVETVSHDLRQPLTMISGYATMIQMVGEINDQQRSYLQKITNGLETMNRMVNNILDLGRIEAGTRLRLEKVDVKSLIEQVVEEFTPQAVQKKIILTNTTNLDSPMVIEADNELLHQAIFNIVENAIKFTGIDGKVDIKVEKEDGKCVISIHDTGIGISPIDLPGLFNRSGRGNMREAGQRASKLGLTIVKSIVELHGGEVHVESQLGKGSVFRIEIPI